MFTCVCPMVISSIFGKSFHFPFPYFVLFVLRYFPFHMVYIYIWHTTINFRRLKGKICIFYISHTLMAIFCCLSQWKLRELCKYDIHFVSKFILLCNIELLYISEYITCVSNIDQKHFSLIVIDNSTLLCCQYAPYICL